MTLSASNTFTGSTIVGAGTLALSGDGSITTCSNITVAGGATLDASGRSDGTLTLVAGQTLNGSGAINGNLTNGPGATVSPGMSIGTLNVSGTVSLEGTTFIEIDKTQPQTSDQLVVGGDLIYGGALSLTNLSDSLSVTDTFQLFVAGSYSGAFNNITPSTPGPGLAWDTSMLTNNGTLGILSTTPAIMQSLLLPDHNFQLSGTGPSGAAYRILAATDVTQPIGSWVQIGLGTFTDGAFSFSDLQATNFPQRFYRVVTP